MFGKLDIKNKYLADLFVEMNFWKSGQKKGPYIHWHITWLLFVIHILPIGVEAFPWGTRTFSSQLITTVTDVKYLNFALIINIWKKKTEMEQEREEVGWMKDYKVEKRDMKLC